MWDTYKDTNYVNVYYLGADVRHRLSNPWGTSHRIGGDPYAARLRALQHAAQAGARHAVVMQAEAEVLRVVAGPAGPTPLRSQRPELAHGLLLYAARLLDQHAAAVLLPRPGLLPLSGGDYFPTIPTVSVYRVRQALATGRVDQPDLEFNLCKMGHRVITLGDYAWHLPRGVQPRLDCTGTTATWKRAYEQAIGKTLDLHPRN